MTEKLVSQEKSLTEKMTSCQKTLTDKITVQEKTAKETAEKIGQISHRSQSLRSNSEFIRLNFPGKLEKADSGAKADTSSSAKLVTLTKAIDSIQENSKSLETMGKPEPLIIICNDFPVTKMKTEFATPKDLEKLRCLKTNLLVFLPLYSGLSWPQGRPP